MKGLSSKEMLEKANSEVEGISVHDVNKLILDKKYQVIDIRDRDELMAFGTIPGAKHASRGKIEFFADPGRGQRSCYCFYTNKLKKIQKPEKKIKVFLKTEKEIKNLIKKKKFNNSSHISAFYHFIDKN